MNKLVPTCFFLMYKAEFDLKALCSVVVFLLGNDDGDNFLEALC